MSGQVCRTSESRFANLVDYDYEPVYTTIPRGLDSSAAPELRMAHVECGPAASGEVILLLHGQPAWGYLWRHVMPQLAAAGHAVVVPDLVGFGRSDKPLDLQEYTYANHVVWLEAWFKAVMVPRRATVGRLKTRCQKMSLKSARKS